ncbi:DUF4230 domain-containing protein [Clostridium rectalis]|uniref:DUF4230 domain-containing protein n=1 Tax=Clostridium rectalis TaxID=2040295 RepID=UPI000F62CF37|nr:DUF4230 domain-containing protein [Clostridium rectalis]
MNKKSQNKFLLIIIGFIIFYTILIKSDSTSLPGISKEVNSISKRTITSEAIINKIHEKEDLITMEIELSDKVMLNDSWGEFNIFRKITYINFYSKSIYSIDLSKVQKKNISIDNKDKTIKITVPKPNIKSINIDEKKTSYETKMGALRFGEIKLTPAENQILITKVKERMYEKLNEPSILNKALYNTEKSLKNLVQLLLNNNNCCNYSISVHFN